MHYIRTKDRIMSRKLSKGLIALIIISIISLSFTGCMQYRMHRLESRSHKHHNSTLRSFNRHPMYRN